MENQGKKSIQTEGDTKSAKGGPASGGKAAVYAMLFELGIEFAVIMALPLLVFIYLGKWADVKTNQHFFVIIGILVGLALSWYMIYRKIAELKKILK